MEKAYEELQVLRSSGEEELLAHEFHPRTRKRLSPIWLELAEERFDFSALVLRAGKGRHICRVTRSLACRFMDVDCEPATISGRALICRYLIRNNPRLECSTIRSAGTLHGERFGKVRQCGWVRKLVSGVVRVTSSKLVWFSVGVLTAPCLLFALGSALIGSRILQVTGALRSR